MLVMQLETAYLLQRLERFEGLAILVTNLRQRSVAFVRRLSSSSITRAHAISAHNLEAAYSSRSTIASDVITTNGGASPGRGRVIRNAAGQRPFRAAAEGMPLGLYHFIHASSVSTRKRERLFRAGPPV